MEEERGGGRGGEAREELRPDTRPPVADRWAGAEMCIFDSIITNGRTDGRTEGWKD